MKTRNIIFITIITFIFNIKISLSDELEDKRRSLEIISSFTDNFCKNITAQGNVKDIEFYGGAKTELNNLFKKIIELGFNVESEYKIHEYQGILQNDLPALIEDNNKCRSKLWDDLKKILINNQSDYMFSNYDIENIKTIMIKEKERIGNLLIKNIHPSGFYISTSDPLVEIIQEKDMVRVSLDANWQGKITKIFKKIYVTSFEIWFTKKGFNHINITHDSALFKSAPERIAAANSEIQSILSPLYLY